MTTHADLPRTPDADDAPTASTKPWAGVASTSRWRWCYALGFLTVVGVGFVAAVLNPALTAWPGEPLLDGRWAEAYQREFDGASPLLLPSRLVWGVIDMGLFGQGRRGVLVGSHGWLYSREEFEAVPDAETAIAAWIDRIMAVQFELGLHGAELVIAIVPAKASMVPDQAPSALPAAAAGRYEALIAGLRAAGVIVSDVRPALADLDQRAFLRTDTHWTPEGAAAAAAAIAATIREWTPFDGLDDTAFATEFGEAREHWGDLTVFLDLGPLLERLGPPPDIIRVPATESLEAPGDDLFAAVEVPVVLVGTSYSADPTWNTAGALREALGSDVIDASLVGLGPWEPMRRYLEGDALRSSPPQVVVWEIPERYLTLAGHVPESARW
jgi:alginate O-acetyltransferase complex protein AlgJ